MVRENEQFEANLQRRVFEAPSEDLASRIIQQAEGIPQRRAVYGWSWFQQLFAEFRLPAPAYSFATLVMVGVAIGLTLPTLENVTEIQTEQPLEISMVQSVIYIDEEF